MAYYKYDDLGNLYELTNLHGLTADRIVLKGVRHGQPTSETNPELWDEVIFGKNALTRELAQTAFGLADFERQMDNARRHEKELRGRVERMDDSQLTWAAARADQIKAAGILGVIIALLVIAILVVILVWLLDRRVDVRIKKDND